MRKSSFTYVCIALFLQSCDCKDSKNTPGFHTFLDREYDFVYGVLVPDEDRQYPTEVFVGRLINKVPAEGLVSGAVQDTFMSEQIRLYQDNYVATIEYHDDASVTIRSDDQEIQLQSVGSGTYRDVNNELRVEPQKTYQLEVRRRDRVYTDEVEVPGDLQVLTISNGDTIEVYPKGGLSSTICYTFYPINARRPSNVLLFRHSARFDIPETDGWGKYVDFEPDGVGVPAIFDTIMSYELINYQWEMFAMDSSLSRFYQNEGVAANREEFQFLDYWNNPGNIEKRSSIDAHGAKNVIGNFGAYNAVRLNFTVRGLRDSCLCTRYPPACP